MHEYNEEVVKIRPSEQIVEHVIPHHVSEQQVFTHDEQLPPRVVDHGYGHAHHGPTAFSGWGRNIGGDGWGSYF